MNKEKIVYARWIAYQLRLRGFKLIRITPNPIKIGFDAFVFEDSPELEKAFGEIVKGAKSNGDLS